MKKLLFLLLIAVFIVACRGEFDNVKYTITNDSSKNITFVFFNDITDTLGNGKSMTYIINSEQGRFAPQKINFPGHKKSVNLEILNNGTAGIFYTFTDNTPLALNVVNMLSIPVTIKADDFIAVAPDTGNESYDEEEFTLKIKENSEETALIYTSAPNFSVKDERTPDSEQAKTVFIPYPYPYTIKLDWELIDDTINLTIK